MRSVKKHFGKKYWKGLFLYLASKTKIKATGLGPVENEELFDHLFTDDKPGRTDLRRLAA